LQALTLIAVPAYESKLSVTARRATAIEYETLSVMLPFVLCPADHVFFAKTKRRSADIELDAVRFVPTDKPTPVAVWLP